MSDKQEFIDAMKASTTTDEMAGIANKYLTDNGRRLPTYLEVITGFSSVLQVVVGKEAGLIIASLAGQATRDVMEENDATEGTGI